MLKLYPTHDLAAFNIPEALLYDLIRRAMDKVFSTRRYLEAHNFSGREIREKLDEEITDKISLFFGLYDKHKKYGSLVRDVEKNSDPELREENTRGAFAGRIFRNAKHVQYQNSPRRSTYAGWLDSLDLSNMTVEELLVAEAWALEYIDDALYQFGLGGPPDSEGSPNYIVDVTEALERVVEAYGPPESEPRELLEEEEGIVLE